jgi:uncharacterized membrane protein YuzA (DUF378 family)
MGLDFIELIFQMLGRGIFWVVRLLLGNHFQLSEGAYELIGFAFVIILIIGILSIMGAMNV